MLYYYTWHNIRPSSKDLAAIEGNWKGLEINGAPPERPSRLSARRGPRHEDHYRNERAHTIAMATVTEVRRRMRPWVALQWNGEGNSPVYLQAAINSLAIVFGDAHSRFPHLLYTSDKEWIFKVVSGFACTAFVRLARDVTWMTWQFFCSTEVKWSQFTMFSVLELN